MNTSPSLSQWHGFTRQHFTVAGCAAWVAEPRKALRGNPWSWCLEFPDAFTERCAAPQLLQAGFHHAYLERFNNLGAPSALKVFSEFHAALVARGLSAKVALIGISRGGLSAYRWAAANPDKVAVLYGDAPVCDFKSWPGGKGTGAGSPPDWEHCRKVYGFRDEAEALAFPGNPVDLLAPLARARVPIIHVVGDADAVVPVAENSDVVERRYRELGGEIVVIHKPGVGHHPHGLDDPQPVVDFILRAAREDARPPTGTERVPYPAAREPSSGGWSWQPDCWDTQMRSGAHYHDQWEYVRQNPVRKGLARKPDDWPWQGVLNVLEWSV